jgi:hypothetical protein
VTCAICAGTAFLQDFRKATTFLFETQRRAAQAPGEASLMLRLDYNAFFRAQANPTLL